MLAKPLENKPYRARVRWRVRRPSAFGNTLGNAIAGGIQSRRNSSYAITEEQRQRAGRYAFGMDGAGAEGGSNPFSLTGGSTSWVDRPLWGGDYYGRGSSVGGSSWSDFDWSGIDYPIFNRRYSFGSRGMQRDNAYALAAVASVADGQQNRELLSSFGFQPAIVNGQVGWIGNAPPGMLTLSREREDFGWSVAVGHSGGDSFFSDPSAYEYAQRSSLEKVNAFFDRQEALVKQREQATGSGVFSDSVTLLTRYFQLGILGVGRGFGGLGAIATDKASLGQAGNAVEYVLSSKPITLYNGAVNTMTRFYEKPLQDQMDVIGGGGFSMLLTMGTGKVVSTGGGMVTRALGFGTEPATLGLRGANAVDGWGPYRVSGEIEITTPGTAMRTYYPPNSGFYGTPATGTLSEGYRFSRYGGFFDDTGVFKDFGNFVAPENVPFYARALPPEAEFRPLSVYEVIKPMQDVKSGSAAPWFNQLGLGAQHELPMTIQDYIDQGYIRMISRKVPTGP